MSYSFSISSVAGQSSRAAASSSRFSSSQKTSAPSQSSLDAAIATVSPTDRVSGRATQDALRTISDSASFISVAASAANDITRLLKEAADIATQYDTEVDADRKLSLRNSFSEKLNAANNITSSATFNDESVINAGETTFQYDLNGGSLSSDTEFRLTVPNIDLSASGLGLTDYLNKNSLDTYGADAALDAVASALETVGGVKTALQDSANQINSFAESIGLSAAVTLEDSSSGESVSPEELAKRIASNIKTSPAGDTNALDPLRVSDLISSSTASSS